MLKVVVAIALGLLISLVAVTNSNSQEQSSESEDARIRLCQQFGQSLAGIVQNIEADKAAGVDREMEVSRTTARIAELNSDAVSSTPPKDAKAYAQLIVGQVWFPTSPDVSHQAEASVVSFCNM